MVTLQLGWSANPPSEQVLSYDVQLFRNGTLAGQFNTTAPSFSQDNPSPGVYSFSVRANNVAGSSAFSALAQGPTVPSVPTNLTITSVVS